MLKFLFSFILLGFILTNFTAKASSNSQDPTASINEIKLLLNHPSLSNKEKKEFKEKFHNFWNKAQLSDQKRDSILSICQVFRSKHARVVPDFHDYFKALILFEEKKRSDSDYTNWQRGLIQELTKPRAKLSHVNAFLKQTIHLLNDQLLFKSFSIEWKARGGNFHYEYDSTLKIIFNEIDLICYSQKDSSVIYNTDGTYFPFEKEWTGKKGKIAWTRAGKSPTDEYAEFKTYSLNITKTQIHIDSVQYNNPQLLKKPANGSLIENVNPVRNPSSATYPHFTSFEKNISIDSLFENINYLGGIEIKGAKLIGRGNSEQPAKIELIKDGNLFINASSEYFSFSNQTITGQNTEITLHLDTFKIYHPNLLLKFLLQKKELTLTKDGTGMSQSLYLNNYHNIQMDFEVLHWKMNDSIIHFRNMMGASNQPAKFESVDYFTENYFQKLQGFDDKHPLVLLNEFAKNIQSNTFTVEEYATFIKKPLSQTRQQIMELSFHGFISYTSSSDEITIRERSINYILAAMGKQDYDIIRFASKPERLENNAILNLNNFDLQINGVKHIAISHSKKIAFIPKGGKLLVKQNRDFEFNGLVKAGDFNFYGKDYRFSYNNFNVDMGIIDSLKTIASSNTEDELARTNGILLENIIKNTSASLQIDAPYNKSGNENLEDYPTFDSYDSCYIYYEEPHIQNSAYKKSNFYIKVDPFNIGNINKLAHQDIQFVGDFESGGITPPFRVKVIVNKDNSIGFAHKIEKGSILIHNKATLTGSLFLDNDGFWGKGTFSQKKAKLISDHLTLLPNAAKGEAKSYQLMAQTTPSPHPDINGENIWVEWESSDDIFHMQSKDKANPIKMYRNKVALLGHVSLKDNRMIGHGEITHTSGTFISNHFNFKNKITADTSHFKLLSNNKSNCIFEAKMCHATIDLANQLTHFKSTIPNNYSSLPTNNYICQLNSFKWNMANNQIIFGHEEYAKLNTLWKTNKINTLPQTSYNVFISTHHKQDSFRFVTPYAIYDTTNYTINAKFVEKLKVADANILPLEGHVTVNSDGYLAPLENSKILTDTLHSLHQITDASIKIEGKNKYSATGLYAYKDELANEQIILFKEISVDTSGQTIAETSLADSLEFTLSPHFDFRGNVKLSAREKHLRFNGETKIHNKCDNIKDNWLSFNALINPKDVKIPIDTIGKNKQEVKVFNSLFLTNDSVHIYPTFLSSRKFYTDNPLLSVAGYLAYNKTQNLYQIASEEKLNDLTKPGGLISYDMNNCNLSGEGLINLGVELGHVITTASGSVNYDSNTKDVSIKTCLGFNFNFSKHVLTMINQHYSSSAQTPSNLNNEHFLRTFPLILPTDGIDDILDEIKTSQTYQTFPDTANQTLFFNQVNLKWNPKDKCYYSEGKLDLGSIFNTTHNTVVKGKIEIKKNKRSSRMQLYFELENGNWLYFEYQNQIIFMRSSIQEINGALGQIRSEDKHYRDPKTKLLYTYQLAPTTNVVRFKRDYDIE